MNLMTKGILIATTVGTVITGSVAWTSGDNLKNVKTIGQGFSNQLKAMSDESKAMFDKFNVFRQSTEDMLNAKITKINDLKAQIEDLKSQLGTSGADNTALQQEISRLSGELDKANQQAMDLEKDFRDMEDSTVAYVNANSKGADDLNTDLSLIEETPDSPTQPQAPESPQPVATTTTQMLDDLNAQTNTGATINNNTIGIRVGASEYFKTSQEVIDWFTNYEVGHDVPQGTNIQNLSNMAIIYVTN